MKKINLGQILGITVILLSLGLIIYQVLQTDSTVTFYNPEEIYKDPTPFYKKTFRVAGVVKEVKQGFEEGRMKVTFTLTDLKGHDFLVTFYGVPPDLFKEEQGVIMEGHLVDGGGSKPLSVLSSKLIVKHSEVYDTKFDHVDLKTTKFLDSTQIKEHQGL
jgi:cytochrome c-type biogenesis protein CcmE